MKRLLLIICLAVTVSSCARVPVYGANEPRKPACAQISNGFKCFPLEQDLDGTRLYKMYPIDWKGMPSPPSNPN